MQTRIPAERDEDLAVPSCGGRLSAWPTGPGWTTDLFDTAVDKTVSWTVAGMRAAMTNEPVHAHVSRVR